jgi:hypothetical protein
VRAIDHIALSHVSHGATAMRQCDRSGPWLMAPSARSTSRAGCSVTLYLRVSRSPSARRALADVRYRSVARVAWCDSNATMRQCDRCDGAAMIVGSALVRFSGVRHAIFSGWLTCSMGMRQMRQMRQLSHAEWRACTTGRYLVELTGDQLERLSIMVRDAIEAAGDENKPELEHLLLALHDIRWKAGDRRSE